MIRRSSLLRWLSIPSLLLCGTLAKAGAAFGFVAPGPLEWDTAFADRSGEKPLHFRATYMDSAGHAHTLEEWRQGASHIRRKTDDRIDLHADVVGSARPGLPADYVWQVIDLQKHVDHRISTQGMMKAGMIYSYWSMAHVLTRPAGKFSISPLASRPELKVGGFSCRWYRIDPSDQAASQVCWATQIGVPLRIEALGADRTWKTTFSVDTVDSFLAPKTFTVDVAGLRVIDADGMSSED